VFLRGASTIEIWQEYVELLKLDSTIFDDLVGASVNPRIEEAVAIGAAAHGENLSMLDW
jgi:hypothetical protein